MNVWELGILDWIRETVACPFLDVLMPLITLLGEAGIFWIALSLLCILLPKTRKMGLTMLLALSIGLLVGNGIIKNIVGRVRPYDLNPDVTLLVKRLSDYSFPSGHSLASFECATSMMLYNRKLGVPAMVLATLVALSRVYLYVHYPTDVLGGALIGSLFAVVSFMLINAAYRKWGNPKGFLR